MPRADAVPDDIEDRDPGLAAERTSLAWTRSALSLGVTGALFIRFGTTTPGMETLGYLLGGVTLLAAVGAWLGVPAEGTAAFARARGHERRAFVRRVAAGTAALSVAALAVAVLTLLR
ncbi:MAG TPA: DUF202 domain-containing protein [Solirubrobacteraceae bacterium]|nr:DUF202 domain-containing protein [Solirubrobacteraceae bacterium]